MLIVKKNNKWGIINVRNEVVCPFFYDEIEVLLYKETYNSNGNEYDNVIPPSDFGERIYNSHEQHSSYFVLKTRIGNKYGLMTHDCIEIVPCYYDDISGIDDLTYRFSIFQSRIGEKIGLIGACSKNEIISCICDEFDFSYPQYNDEDKMMEDIPFDYSLFYWRMVIHRMLINPTLLNPENVLFVKYRIESNWGLVKVHHDDGRQGVSEILLRPEFDKIETVDFIDFKTLKNGKWKIHLLSNSLYAKHIGLSARKNMCGIFTLLNVETFEELQNTEFDEVIISYFGYFIIKKNGKYGLIDKYGIGVKEGFYVLNPEYDNINIRIITSVRGFSSGYRNGEYQLILIEYGNKYGLRLIDSDNLILELDKVILNSEGFDYRIKDDPEILIFEEPEILIFEKNNKFGLFDWKLNVEVPAEYDRIVVHRGLSEKAFHHKLGALAIDDEIIDIKRLHYIRFDRRIEGVKNGKKIDLADEAHNRWLLRVEEYRKKNQSD